MSFVQKTIAFGFAFQLFFSSQARPETCSQNSPLPVSLTLSGGVSLGAYQAGFLYYTGQVFHENAGLFEPKIMTGASAGGINTLLSVFSLCANEAMSPSQSALWQTWIDLNTQLFLSSNEDKRALLSKNAFVQVAENVKKLWFEGLPKSCDLVIGVPATRISPDKKLIWSELKLGRQEEKFTFRIRGRGPHQAPLITNYINPLSSAGQALLALTPSDDSQNFDSIRDLIFATSAFPLVFPPQKLSYCIADPKSPRWLHGDSPFTCLPNEIETAEFLDGGLFDNRPIGIADQISRSGLVPANHCVTAKFREIPLTTSEMPVSNPSVLFMYLDNDLHAYPTSKAAEDEKFLLPYLGSFLSEFINSSQSRDVLSSFEANPSLQYQVAVGKNSFPRMSDPMFGFFGFIEKDFRKFDFYLGMYEAHHYFKNQIRDSLKQDSQYIGKNLILPEDKFKNTADWRPFACLSQLLKHSEGDACRGADTNFKILAQISEMRLEALCQAYGSKKNREAESSCQNIKFRENFENGESDLGFTLRKLTDTHFEYKDLGLGRLEGAKAGARMKTEILKTVDRLASAQPWPDNVAVSAIGPVVSNSIEHLPTEKDGFVTYGPVLKFGISNLISPFNTYPTQFRIVGEVQLRSIDSWLGNGGSVVPSVMAGLEYEVKSLSSVILQTRLRLLGGYQFHSQFAVIGSGCLDTGSASDCRGPLVQPGISLSILERVRLQLDAQYFAFSPVGPRVLGLVPSLGIQFYF